MSWGSSVRTVYVTLTDKPQSIRSLMPIYCQCGRMVLDWMFASATDMPACPHCGGNISNSKELEPLTGFYHKVGHVGEVHIDEVSKVQQQKTKRQFSQLLCNWEDEGRGNCHAGMCEWQDPLWHALSERDKWKEDKATNSKYPAHFPVIPQHVMLGYSYDKKGPAIFRFGNMMKGELEKIHTDKGRLAGRDITIYKKKEGNQTKHIATGADPSPFNIPRDSFDEDALNELIKIMRDREEPPSEDRIIPYLAGDVVSLSRPRIDVAKVAIPGTTPLGNIGPIPIDPSKPMTGVTPQPQLPAGVPPTDTGSVSDAAGMVMPKGKHKSKSLGDIMESDPSYITWIANNMGKDNPDLAAAATILLSGRSQDSPAAAPPSQPPVTETPSEQPAEQPAPEPEPEPPTTEPTEEQVAGVPDNLLDACNQILNNDPRWKDNAALKGLLDKHGEGLEAFEKYQIGKWDNERLVKLHEDLKG